MLVCFLANESEEKIDSRLLSHIFAQRLEMGGKQTTYKAKESFRGAGGFCYRDRLAVSLFPLFVLS